MDEWVFRWQQLAGWLRIVVIAGIWLLCAFLLHYYLLRPQWQHAQHLQLSQQQQKALYNERLQTFGLNAPPAQLEEQNNQLRIKLQSGMSSSQPFALTPLLSASGGSLEKWLPQQGKAELSLLLAWPQLQRLNAWLVARHPPLQPMRLQIKPQGERLFATIWLAQDEN